MRAQDIVEEIDQKVAPLFRGLNFRVKRGQVLANDDSVYITYAQTPEDAPEIDALNAPANIMVSITDDRDYGPSRWVHGEPAPAKIRAKQFRGRPLKMRSKSGSPAAVTKYVVKWFEEHAPELRGKATVHGRTR